MYYAHCSMLLEAFYSIFEYRTKRNELLTWYPTNCCERTEDKTLAEFVTFSLTRDPNHDNAKRQIHTRQQRQQH